MVFDFIRNYKYLNSLLSTALKMLFEMWKQIRIFKAPFDDFNRLLLGARRYFFDKLASKKYLPSEIDKTSL